MKYIYLFTLCAAFTGCQAMSDLLDIGSSVHEIGAGPTDAELRQRKADCFKKLDNTPRTQWGEPNPDYEYQKKKCEGMK